MGKRILIQERIRRYLSLMSVLPVLLFSIVLTAYAIISVWNASSAKLTSLIERAQTELNQLLEEGYQVGKSVEDDSEIINALTIDFASEQERLLAELKINNELSYISRYFDRRIQLYIIAENGALFKNGRYSFTHENYRETDWYREISGSKDSIWFPLCEESRVVHSVSGNYATLGIPIRSRGDAKLLGVLLVEVQVEDILNDMAGLDQHFYIISPNKEMQIINERVEQYENDVISTIENQTIQTYYKNDPKPEYVEATSRHITYWRQDFKPSDLRNSDGYELCYAIVNANQWILVSCVPYLQIYRVPILVGVLSMLGVLTITFLVMLMAHRASHTLTNPIKVHNNSVQRVGMGNFDIDIVKTSDDEIGDLSDQFAQMVRRIKELMSRIIEEQRIQRKYELLLLQAQINPHFLYNTLDSIVWLVRMRKNEDAEIMLGALTEFFKTGLNRGHDTMSLDQEIKNVQSYLTIQMYRYKSKLSYEIEVEDAVRDVQLPKLILRPLVENSIYHGIKEKDGPGRISIRCGLDGQDVLICIADDGLGMPAEKLERLRADMHTAEVKNRSSYGMQNVYERLRLFFHEKCSMEIESSLHVGTRIRIRIPGKEETDVLSDHR